MKSYKIITFLIILLSGSASFGQKNKPIIISGVILGIEKPTSVQLLQFTGTSVDSLTTVNSSNGVFTIRLTKTVEPKLYYLKVAGLNGSTQLFVDNNDVQVKGEASKWPKISVSGSSTHEDYRMYRKLVDTSYQKLEALYNKLGVAQNLKDSANIISIGKELKLVSAHYEHQQVTFVKAHPNSMCAVTAILFVNWNWMKKRDLFDILSPQVKSSTYGRVLAKNLAIWKKQSGLLEVGDTIPSFATKTSKNKDLVVKDAIKSNKLTLIDFWASWCAPCREENPYLVKTYKENKSKGFDILSISLDEKDTDWRHAIEKDGLLWDNVSDLKGWASPIAKLYLAGMPFNFIPQNFLVDANGKILATNMRGEQLIKKIKELLK